MQAAMATPADHAALRGRPSKNALGPQIGCW
jgi:hypothetical protein